MKHFFSIFIVVFLSFISAVSVNAESDFEMNLNIFYQQQQKASKILKEIETELKNGSRDRVCKRQREAASYGIEATESLIKILKSNGSKIEIDKLQSGLDKWRELRDNCY
tara:strand:- start:239 stop:568 length:330 start_codon:yes stop_codon:yes gene_type:complete